MNNKHIRILLIEDNPGDVRLIREMLSEVNGTPFDLECVDQLSTGLQRLAAGGIDILLLDLALPDSCGLDTFTRVRDKAPELPIVVLTVLDNTMLAIKAVREGAQDYLVKGQVDSNLLIRSMHYAIERKRMEEENKKFEAQLRHAQKMEAVGTLAGGIAHDFNNTLQAISGHIQLLLRKKGKNDPDRKHLNQIGKSIRRATELVQQLLIFSRKVESKLMPVGLNWEIIHIHKMLGQTIPRMVDVELYLADDIKTINADPTQLEQIMMNLTLNARDAMPDGGRLVIETENTVLDEEYCRTHIGATAGEYVLLTISDTGCGMNKETLKHIFEPFYTTKEADNGTGLGLAIVYGIVKSHDGYIMCYSEPGQGTIFKIYFPVLETKGIEQISELKEVEEEEIHGGYETILLVDDEKGLLDIEKEILGQYGYTAITAESGEEAVEVYKMEGDRIDVVLLDVGMPGMGGHKCLQELLGINPEVRVIITSGYSASGKVKETLEAGAAGFIGKPHQLNDMLKKVREVLDRKIELSNKQVKEFSIRKTSNEQPATSNEKQVTR